MKRSGTSKYDASSRNSLRNDLCVLVDNGLVVDSYEVDSQAFASRALNSPASQVFAGRALDSPDCQACGRWLGCRRQRR